jgi:hypothetical protein
MGKDTRKTDMKEVLGLKELPPAKNNKKAILL